MEIKDPLGKFYKSYYDFEVSDEWIEILHGYIVHGLPPGSFFTAMLSNNFVEMACRSHPSNSWSEMMQVGKWLLNIAPRSSWGSIEKVNTWLALGADERVKICENAGLVATAWEILQHG